MSQNYIRYGREQRGTDAAQGGSQPKKFEEADLSPPIRRTRVSNPRFVAIVKRAELDRAKTALEFYEKSLQDAQFEILEVLGIGASELKLLESDEIAKFWLHITFIAKPKIAGNSDVSPTHFFGELFKDHRPRKFHATYCSTFEPSDDPGFNHGCIFCSPEQVHPADGYLVGRPPWYRPKVRYGLAAGMPLPGSGNV